MRLNQDLAQRVVDKTMNVLGKNINIMDHEGIIIGSGDRERLNTFHEVAKEVVKSGKPCIISSEEAGKFQGVKAGINLPVKFQEDIIGVVGITGKVEEVKGYGQIVKNMVELILQQEFLRREMEIKNKARENFFQQLIGNSISSRELLEDKIQLYNINTNISRVIMLINLKPFNNKKISLEIEHLLNYPFIIAEKDIFFIRGENIVLIKKIEDVKPQQQSQQTLEIARKIKNKLQDEFNDIHIGIGQIFCNLDKLHLSYRGAKQALTVGEKVNLNQDDGIYYINHLGFDYFLPAIKSRYSDYYLKHQFDRNFYEIFADTNTGEVVEALVKNDLNITQTARELYIHRNTLLYRIKKIKKITGLDPGNARDLFTLLFAYHLYLYNS